jgi:hypothetical protein
MMRSQLSRRCAKVSHFFTSNGRPDYSEALKQQLESDLLEPLHVVLVDERYSSLKARDRYWQMYPLGFLSPLATQLKNPTAPLG